MPRSKPCHPLVEDAGANLVKLRRMAEDFRKHALVTYESVEATMPIMMALGVKNMEYGTGLALLTEAMKAPDLVRQAHNSFRLPLSRVDMDEPSDAAIVSRLGGVITPNGGGGGNR